MRSKAAVCSKGRVAAVAAFVVLTAAAPACAAGSMPSDAWITAKVKLSLMTTDGVSAGDVNVDTVERHVTLHGSVHTAAEKQTAERTATAVQGAESVRNLLQVVPAALAAAVEEKDEEIRKGVSAALVAEPSLAGSAIAVQSVNKGVVLLGGKAENLSDHLTAVELASQVRGVRRVASEIQSPEVLADASIWKERNIPVGGDPKPGFRTASADLYTTSMVKVRLLADRDTPAMNINVDTRFGVVTLFGIVPTAASRAAAEAEARKTSGVVSVVNELQIVSAAKQPAVEARDDVIERHVKTNLEKDSDLHLVSGEVKNCVVRLTGSVSSGFDRVKAMQVARATSGVCSVNEELLVR